MFGAGVGEIGKRGLINTNMALQIAPGSISC